MSVSGEVSEQEAAPPVQQRSPPGQQAVPGTMASQQAGPQGPRDAASAAVPLAVSQPESSLPPAHQAAQQAAGHSLAESEAASPQGAPPQPLPGPLPLQPANTSSAGATSEKSCPGGAPSGFLQGATAEQAMAVSEGQEGAPGAHKQSQRSGPTGFEDGTAPSQVTSGLVPQSVHAIVPAVAARLIKQMPCMGCGSQAGRLIDAGADV
jgi:hypothetical protein